MEKLLKYLQPHFIETPICGPMYVLPDGRILDCTFAGNEYVSIWRYMLDFWLMDNPKPLDGMARIRCFGMVGTELRRRGWIKIDTKGQWVERYKRLTAEQKNTLQFIRAYFTLTKDYVADRTITCCFTGPRSKNYPSVENFEETVTQRLKEEIQKAIDEGYRCFMSGMAAGVDLIAAAIVLNYKKQYPELKITLEGVIPFQLQSKRWTEERKAMYQSILDECDRVEYIAKEESVKSYEMRDRFMVDNSHLVIAVESQGNGTKRTVEYASKLGKEIRSMKV